MKIDLHKPILDKNDQLAAQLRERFAENHVYVLELLYSRKRPVLIPMR